MKLKEITYLPRTNDIIFKKIFGDRKNINILKGFLKAILNLPENEYDVLEITDSHSKTENTEINEDSELITNMESILDIKLITKNGKRIDVEMQIKSSPIMSSRVVKYCTDMLNEQIKVGTKKEKLTTEQKYKNLQKVISIIITVKHKMYKDDRYLHRFHLNEDFDVKIRFSDLIEINVLELPKLPNDDGSDLWNWLRFLKSGNKEEISMLAQRDDAIKEAVCVLEELSENYTLREMARRREAFLQDQEAREEEKYEMGRAKGIMEGIMKGKMAGIMEGKIAGEKNKMFEIAKKMLKKNYRIEDIAEDTGLTISDINSLGQ